ncbi:CidA/LrgA family protein [Gallaecimonas pentaromativorans]|uniref:Holin-like protein n=1 Tax=Gallaecimonas pentaromativorans TaxID=584787 RepID=A0A3N1PIZ9_9GAMM|nr:CidA/LrgA family protein [Gallaecimonas pentaromativorans]MED5524598.1 CidA/LrgA family protein [Pseudomonadota bacterium]ROQ28605.1 holin-like protein [Gallaecimonas pentaromativorans]
MTAQYLRRRFRYGFHQSRLLQVGLIFGFYLLGQALVSLTGLPVTGGIAGMVLVLLLLGSRLMSLASMRRGADWYLAQMLLFFVPAVLAITDHHELLGVLGLKVVVVILGSTLAVVGVTALVMDLCLRLRGHDAQ